MELFQNPGCGLALMVPIILMSAGLTFPWFWLALRQVSIGRVLIVVAVGVPIGLYVAHREMG
jgi:hypothetical protein